MNHTANDNSVYKLEYMLDHAVYMAYMAYMSWKSERERPMRGSKAKCYISSQSQSLSYNLIMLIIFYDGEGSKPFIRR